MKKYVLVFLFPFFTFTSRAQCGDIVDLIVAIIATSDEGGYECKTTFFDTQPGTLHGARFGWAINRFTLGTSGYAGINTINHRFLRNRNELTMVYWSMFGEYHFRKYSGNHHHFSGIFHMGRGWASVTGSPSGLSDAAFWQAEPGFNFNLYALKIIRLHIGASYRFMISDSYLYGQTDGTLSGPCINAGLTFTGRGF